MATKIIYFVRHGETESNVSGVRQGEGGSLTQRGRDQALATAKRFPKENGRPQIIYASPFQRTKETAGIIAKELGLKIKYTDLLKERKNPTEIIGHWGGEPGIKNIIVPRSNLQDIVIDDEKLKSIRIIPVDTLTQVLSEVLDWKGKEKILKEMLLINGD